MALQDLTPQLRTRLSRMERAVGWFVFLATALLVAGFVYYIYHEAKSRGWFLKKIDYQTCVSSGAGLKVGDPVKLMGFDVGEITRITPNDPYAYYNITVFFRIKSPHYGYIWSDSQVKVNASDFLGNRFLEITKGVAGVPTILEATNETKEVLGVLKHKVIKQRTKELEKQGKSAVETLAQLNTEATLDHDAFYTNAVAKNVYFLDPLEAPAISERLDKLVSEVEAALPNILNLTNKIAAVLDHSAALTSNLNTVAVNVQPVIQNVADLTAQLRGPGALGGWLLSSNMNGHLEDALAKVDSALTTVDTNLPATLDGINRSLENLAGITANLRAQVEANTNVVGNVTKAIVDTDDLVQGLKRHWLLRSAFKPAKPNAPPSKPKR